MSCISTKTAECTNVEQAKAFAEYVKHPSFIPALQFETSTICDGACTFCHHKDMARHGNMKWSTITEIIDTCVPHAQTAMPFIYGEPCLEPRLTAILDNIKQVNHRCQTLIYSNMHSMTSEKAREIIESQLLDKLVISFYGPTREIYRKLQPTFNWERTRRNIKTFMATRDKLGYNKPDVRMHYIALPELIRESKQFFDEWKPLIDNIGFTVYRTDNEENTRFAEGFEKRIWGELQHKRLPCQRAWAQFYFHYNGDAVSCCSDYRGDHVIGNIHEQDPLDIWWSEKAQAFRQRQIDGDYPEMCRYCNYWKYEADPEWIANWTNYQKNCLST